MKAIIRRINIIFFCGFLFVIDRWLKWQALHSWASDRLLNRWFGWHPFFNSGVAFGIPVPGWLAVLLTVPVLGIIIFILLKQAWHHSLCLLLIFVGALSNLIDRVGYGHTVDYVLIFSGVINLADVMIVAGFGMYFLVTYLLGEGKYD